MLLQCPDSENGLLNSDHIKFVRPVVLDGERFMMAAFCAGDPNPVPIFYGTAEQVDDAMKACGEMVNGTLALGSFSMLVDGVRERRMNRANMEMESEERARARVSEMERLTAKAARDRKWFLVAAVVLTFLYLVVLAYSHYHPKPDPFQGVSWGWPQDRATRLRYGWYYLQIGFCYAFISAAISAWRGSEESTSSTAFKLLIWPVSLVASIINATAEQVGYAIKVIMRPHEY